MTNYAKKGRASFSGYASVETRRSEITHEEFSRVRVREQTIDIYKTNGKHRIEGPVELSEARMGILLCLLADQARFET